MLHKFWEGLKIVAQALVMGFLLWCFLVFMLLMQP
jgi:hypothetical protein